MARKTKEEAQETRCAILDAAIQIFSVRGVSRTSLADIAEEAGVTRGAIYWHFANKADLLNALWDQMLLPYEEITRASENSDEPDPLGKMKTLFIMLFNGFIEDPRRKQLFRILLDKCEAVEDTGDIHLRRVSCHLDGFSRIETVLRNAAARGQIPADTDVRLGSIAVISYIDGLIAHYLLIPDLVDIRSEIPLLIEAMLTMLRCGGIRRKVES